MAASGRYTVHFVDEEPPIYYNNGGRGYSLSGAKNFARIGSQQQRDGVWGGDRVVTRGVRGPIIRVYHHGLRLWPLYRSQLSSLPKNQKLTAAETPHDLV